MSLRIFAPTVQRRMFDPMPLPRRTGARRKIKKAPKISLRKVRMTLRQMPLGIAASGS